MAGINTYQNQNYWQKTKFAWVIWTSFQGVNSIFVLAFGHDAQRTKNKRYYLLNVEIKDYNVMIDEKNFFWSTSN